MAKKVKVVHERRGCLYYCMMFLVVCVVISVLAAVLGIIAAVAAGAGCWFLVRYIWRSLVWESPESRIVRFGMARPPIIRKVSAGILCILLALAVVGAVSQPTQRQGGASAGSDGGQATQGQDGATTGAGGGQGISDGDETLTKEDALDS